MWLLPHHDFFSDSGRSILKQGVGKKLFNFATPVHFVLVLGLGLGHFGSAPEKARAQMVSALGRQSPAADFDGTIGMPPYVFRTYHFAAAETGKVCVEVYIGLINDILQFVKISADSGDAEYRAQYEINVTVWDKQKNPLASRNWKRELTVKNFAATNDRKKFNLERAAFDLAPGEYEIALEITDRDTGKNLRERRPLKLNRLDGGPLQLSSVVFTRPVLPAMPPRDSLLYNFAALTMSLPVEARPQNGAGRDMIGAAAYFEIYGARAGETLQLQYQLLDWRRQVLHDWQETLTVTPTPVRHLVDFAGKIKQAGLHTFRLVAQSQASLNSQQKESREAKLQTAEAEESFQVQISADQNDPAALAENKTLLYEPLRHVAKGAEYKQILEAAEAGRDSLVAEFWRRRDPDPATAANQLRDEFYRRVAFAERRFAGAGKSGWETDRGRIYLKYGPPPEVHHQLAEQGEPPYEIWLYPELDLHFIFRDKTGSGDFELVNR